MTGYRLKVHKKDRRCKDGIRFIKSYDYAGYSGNAMMNEIYSLKMSLYPPKDGWILDFSPLTKVVKNLMTGKDIEIDADTPYCCDPSSERYWSM